MHTQLLKLTIRITYSKIESLKTSKYVRIKDSSRNSTWKAGARQLPLMTCDACVAKALGILNQMETTNRLAVGTKNKG